MYMYLYIHVASVGNDDEDACALLQAFWAVLGVSMLQDQVRARERGGARGGLDFQNRFQIIPVATLGILVITHITHKIKVPWACGRFHRPLYRFR